MNPEIVKNDSYEVLWQLYMIPIYIKFKGFFVAKCYFSLLFKEKKGYQPALKQSYNQKLARRKMLLPYQTMLLYNK